jgi:CheY-like chemotaxis protein
MVLAKPSKKWAILLVDDDELVLLATSTRLSRLGHSTFCAQNGYEAVKIFKKNKDQIEAVVLDINMPEKNGIEAYDEIKQLKNDALAVFTTGYIDDSQVEMLRERQIENYIKKPYQAKQIIEALNKHL